MFAPRSSAYATDVFRSNTADAQSLHSNAGALPINGMAKGLADPLHQFSRNSGSSFSSSAAPVSSSVPDLAGTLDYGGAIPIIPIFPIFSDNFTFSANNLGTLEGTRTAVNFVGSSDTHDYYRFHLDYASRFNLSLTELSADADVQLLDRNGNLIASSARGSNQDEAINRASLAAGDYYVRVYQFSGDTNYRLNVSVGSPSNLLPIETNLGILASGITRNASGLINTSNTTDVYHFSLANTSNVNLGLSGLSADFDLRLIRDANSNGVVDLGEEIARSAIGSTTAESINLQGLGAGSYIAQVYQWSGTTLSSNYNLSITASTGLGWATESNNTINTAYNMGTLNGSRGFSGWVSGNSSSFLDTNDFYRFELDTTSNVSLSLSGLSADADVQIIRDANYNGVIDSGEVLGGSYRGSNLAESISLAGLAQGSYLVQVYPHLTAATSYVLNLTGVPVDRFASFSVGDASGDNTSTTVFDDGALRFNYNLAGTADINTVRLEAVRGASTINLGTFHGSSLTDGLINLANFSAITAGEYQLRAIAQRSDGTEFLSGSQTMNVLSWNRTNGTFQGETLNYSAALGTGSVFLGRGGTDTLNLGVARANIASINGISLASYNPLTNSTWGQAFFGGSSFDYMTLTDGREIYFQGVENLRFADGSTFELQVRPNDPSFDDQWNLHVSDVGSAWRFSRGSSNVMLVSLDTGIRAGGSSTINDISTSRLITSTTDDGSDNWHGHRAVSVMASTANNASGVAGINWNSTVYVSDVYGSSRVDLQQAIEDAIAYARANNRRVVFQGGIQGEGWLNDGGSQAQLEQLIRDNSDIAVFAIAAGNGGPGGNLSDANYLTSVSGVAKLQTGHDNVIAVGAARPGSESNFWYASGSGVTTVNGLTNATSISLASYSNRGSNLTLVAATDSPAITETGSSTYFGGTSCANPNMAGIASLVWSVNGSLDGGDVRQILVNTAMDLGVAGRDNTFGSGMVNADAAVRRAYALGRAYDLANLYGGASLFT